MKSWNSVHLLPNIKATTLVIRGEFDQATETVVEPFAQLIPGVKTLVIKGASHTPHLEAPDETFKVIADFLSGQT